MAMSFNNTHTWPEQIAIQLNNTETPIYFHQLPFKLRDRSLWL